MKKGFLLSAIACGVLMGTVSLQAKTDKKVLVQHEMDKQVKNHKQAPKEIIMGMQNTFNALQAMHKGDKKTAQKALEAATQSFDKALKANPALDLIPVDERLQAIAFGGSAKIIAARIAVARQLLKAHDTQMAIDAIAPLKDELDITMIYIPMKIYPAAAKKALELLKKGKEQESMAAIAEAMNSLVAVTTVIPTPILVAQDLIIAASKLDKAKKKEAEKLLQMAKDELNRAELLGYTHKHSAEYKALDKSIEAIQKEIKGKNMVEKLYDKLKTDFKSLIKKTHKDQYNFTDTVAAKENKALQNPSSMKDEASAKAKVEEAQDKEEFKAKEDRSTFQKEVDKDKNKTVQ
jgi:uncharacterized spore protein YtfJ